MKYSALQDTIKRTLRRVTPLAERYRSDSVGLWSTKVAYLSFFSLFPLLLLFSSVLNIVFSGHQAYKESVTSAVDSNFPFLAGFLPSGRLRSSYFAGSAGLIGSLWSGSRLTLALESGLGRIWHIDHPESRTFLSKLLRGALLFILFGVIFIASNIPIALVSGATVRGNVIVQTVGLMFGFILDLVLFMTIQLILGPPRLTYKDHLLGSTLAAVVWLIMVRFGDSLFSKYVSHASQTYGTLGTIIGLFTWLTIGSMLVFGAALINTLEYEKRHAKN